MKKKQSNGTVRVENSAAAGPSTFSIIGTATPVDPAYGAAGAFKVEFPNTPSDDDCPGPNYIVQGKSSLFFLLQGTCGP